MVRLNKSLNCGMIITATSACHAMSPRSRQDNTAAAAVAAVAMLSIKLRKRRPLALARAENNGESEAKVVNWMAKPWPITLFVFFYVRFGWFTVLRH